MTQEEKARAYDEALERARALRQEAIDKGYAIDYVKDYEAIFPELAESEDERIRKKIIENVRLSGGYTDEEIDEMISWLEKQKEQKPAEWSEDAEQAAARYERENRQSVLSSVDIVNAFIEGARWKENQMMDEWLKDRDGCFWDGVNEGKKAMENQMPQPEDSVIFQKGVAEGRRLEREDDNKALAEMYGYEGGTESPLVKITFTIPKEHFNRLMPIKQGDVFGIENLTNKEGIR